MKRLGQLAKSATALGRLLWSHSIRLETSSKCQLKCPACPTAKGFNRTGVVGWGDLTLEAFERFVRVNPHICHIEISNWGEIFLNPELSAILKHAHESGIELTADNGVNFNSVRENTLEALVKYRVRRLTVAIDGATRESYREYRKGGDFDRVISNIRKLNDYKRRYKSRYPILTWQFVIFGHNEHELAEARSMARSLGMHFATKLNVEGWGEQYSPVKDRERVRSESGFGASSFTEFRERYGRELLAPCQDLWLRPQVNWDGKLLGCCVNMWGDFGNVFESGLDECLASERYVYTQRMLLGEVKARSDSPCVHCHLYENRAMTKLLDSTPAPPLARHLFSARIANSDREKTPMAARIEARIFDAARDVSGLVRRTRGWLNRHRLEAS
jgi:MoaA/NifB/PqqE/SkfB family radical SAM enzyme